MIAPFGLSLFPAHAYFAFACFATGFSLAWLEAEHQLNKVIYFLQVIAQAAAIAMLAAALNFFLIKTVSASLFLVTESYFIVLVILAAILTSKSKSRLKTFQHPLLIGFIFIPIALKFLLKTIPIN